MSLNAPTKATRKRVRVADLVFQVNKDAVKFPISARATPVTIAPSNWARIYTQLNQYHPKKPRFPQTAGLMVPAIDSPHGDQSEETPAMRASIINNPMAEDRIKQGAQ
jgi:hypothetical protein